MSSLDLASLPPVGPTPTAAPPRKDDDAKSAVAPPADAKDERGFFDRIWGKEGFSFGALLDIVNPLQHIPIVGTVYRAITGDSIGPAARIAGGTLFGGVIGLVASSIDSLVEEETGRDFGQHILAMRGDADAVVDPTTPTGRPERDGVLYAGDFSPRPDPARMLADAAPPAAVASAAMPAATEKAAAPIAMTQAAAAQTPMFPPRGAIAGTPAPHEAANGAGGSPVPFATTVNRGRAAAALPTPQSLAADPALLRQMQDAQRQPRNASSIDTTIRANVQAGATASFLDYTPKNAALRSVETDAPLPAKAPAGTPAASAAAPTQIDAGTLPQVPADLIMRMNVALEKYQTMQRVTDRPNLNVTQ